MALYIFKRLLGAIPTLFLVIALSFILVHAAPGGPFDAERVLPPDIEQNILEYYHLDEALPKQFLRYVGNLLQGDMGPSYRKRGQAVDEIIGGRLSFSLTLGAVAMLVALVAGIAAGTWAALHQNSRSDRIVMGFAMTGISIPVFVIAPFLVLILAVKLKILPAGWSGSTGIAGFILPVFTLALPQVAYIARLTRASMIDVLSSPFIRTARAQGLGRADVVRYHALKPAMLPVLSYLGPAIASVLTGSVVVEQIFGIPGVGSEFVLASLNRDYTLVLGIVIVYATLIILLNLLVDVLYRTIDPRVRVARELSA